MFWLAYIVAFFFIYWCSGAWAATQIPRIRLLLSFTGFDGLFLANGFLDFYILGEWFLGFIIIFYLLFPLLRKETIQHPVILSVITVLLYTVLNVQYLFKSWIPSTNIILRMPELLFGMYFMRYIKKVPWYVALTGLLVIILNSFLKPKFDHNIQTTYIGICLFLVLAFVSEIVFKYDIFRNIHSLIKYICKIPMRYSSCIML